MRKWRSSYLLIFLGLMFYVPFVAMLTNISDATSVTTKVALILMCMCSVLVIVVGLEIQREQFIDICRSNTKLKAQLFAARQKGENNGRNE